LCASAMLGTPKFAASQSSHSSAAMNPRANKAVNADAELVSV
jgi:hypothetical protein